MSSAKTSTPSPRKRKLEDPDLNRTIEAIFEDIDKHCSANMNEESFLENSFNIEGIGNGSLGSQNQSFRSNSDEHSRIVVNHKSLEKAVRLLQAPTKNKENAKAKHVSPKKMFSRTCNEGYDDLLDRINWQSYAYLVRSIRHLILHREWQYLSEMLRLLMKQHKIFKNYLKEITYLYYLINADSIDPMEIEEYFQLCFSTTDRKEFREFDIWYKED